MKRRRWEKTLSRDRAQMAKVRASPETMAEIRRYAPPEPGHVIPASDALPGFDRPGDHEAWPWPVVDGG